MTILPVNDPAFAPYGRVIAGYDTAVLLNTLCEKTPKPESGTMYEPSVPALEALPIAKEFSERFYGCLLYTSTSAASIAASEPSPPIATPTSAIAKTGASFIPSPAYRRSSSGAARCV